MNLTVNCLKAAIRDIVVLTCKGFTLFKMYYFFLLMNVSQIKLHTNTVYLLYTFQTKCYVNHANNDISFMLNNSYILFKFNTCFRWRLYLVLY